ncbi:hypothetical protein REPUB_Repub02eG0002100 [Reevesia pubescens]
MKNTLVSIWRTVKGVCIKDLPPTLFLFQFFHELDMDRVLRGGPCMFNQNQLLTSRLEMGMNLLLVPLFHADFWIQIHDLPYGFLSEKFCKEMGNYVGIGNLMSTILVEYGGVI